jgi:DNA polymerase III subunit alpha
MAASSAQARDKAAGQDSSSGCSPGPAAAERRRRAPRGPPRRTSAPERLSFEKELLGFYVSGHPMNGYSGLWEAIDTAPADELSGPARPRRVPPLRDRGQHRQEVREEGQPALGRLHAGHARATIALNMFADAYASYGVGPRRERAGPRPGKHHRGADGPRVNVKECYPLTAVSRTVRKVTWIIRPEHPDLGAFLRGLRETVVREPGDTRIEFAVLFDGRAAPVAEASHALSWR